ncbi:MAG: nitrate reductase molybdenum cofactor assembly chaperone [Terriglobales bacterium]
MKDLYAAMAPLFDYPGPDYLDNIARCLTFSSGEIQSQLRAFRRQIEEIGIACLQEIYIETFDFHAESAAYIGYHLFGEDIRRSLFMAELRGRYRECGLLENSELPDHFANVLRFLGASDAGEERSELIHTCLIPALRHVLRAMKPNNPYTPLLQAILLTSQRESTSIVPAGKIAWTPFSSSSCPTSR